MNGSGKEDRILMGDQCTQIEYCEPHYGELMNALFDRRLGEFISKDADEMVHKLENGLVDAGLEATSAITSASMSLFGPEAVIEAHGCPVCAFQNIITHVADHMAVKYTRSN
ncbi:MAG TPA: hypothetical protein VMW50_02540 [Dehalococcoidia bacterium]|jgi:hypothetical protein|nr:hypothetical protein [Dehalococcoidia bacterium]